ncbi:hypothetical protein [Vitreimonas sp.]|uniref:hypothetical protein n=1 Tax=Vitreimonas sp. TaxID=3069702 RepID=UPI002ED9C459
MRRARAARGSNLLGVALIVAAMAVLGGLGAATFLLRPPPLDETTLCRIDAPLGAHTIVLVDSTDRLEPRHRRKLRAVLMQERARLGQYDRLTIRRLVLISDLLEHDPPSFSLYNEPANYAAWRAASPQGPPDLERVDLRVVPLDRPDHAERQAIALTEFWPSFFDAADVQTVSTDPAP